MSKEERFKPYAAAYLVLLKGGRILLSRRLNTGYQDGNYILVSGHFDGGETAKECMIREATEEIGIILKPEDLAVIHVVHRLSTTGREYFDIYLRAEKWSGEVVNLEPEKCSELTWFDLDNLPENVLPDVRRTLEKIKKGEHYSEFGFNN
ncbi:MAG: NUDIX domain-containing protein [Patescibacteria group bacterium]|jgi:8-oxo-dGTP pyrophosphatase MutT (NUDIX family)